MMSNPRNVSLETFFLIQELLRRIPSRHKISASELHKQLEDAGYPRDIRTIQRWLDQLVLYFDIEQDSAHRPYGYRWSKRPRGFLVPQLSEQESLLLMLAEQNLRPLLPPSLKKAMDGFFIQARSNLAPFGESSAALAREWLSKVRVVSQTQPLLPPQINEAIFQNVSEALYRNQWLAVEYKNAEGNITKADVMPLGLAQQGARLYLVCRFENFDNERSLAIHRILKARARDISFKRPREFNLQSYDESGRFGFSEGKMIALSFEIKKDAGLHLLESPLSKDQQVKETKNHYQIRATVIDTWQLTWWLQGFGANVRNIKKHKVSVKKKGASPR